MISLDRQAVLELLLDQSGINQAVRGTQGERQRCYHALPGWFQPDTGLAFSQYCDHVKAR